MAFYTSPNSTSLKNTQILKDVNVFIQKFESEETGVASISVDDITLTPAVSPAYTVDALISTVANNVVVVADGSKVLEGLVDDNDAVSITFDATTTADYADGTAGAASDFTVATSYDYYVLTPSIVSGATYGDFFGWTEEVTITNEEEFAEFKNGVPRQLKNQCLLERTLSVTGVNANFSNLDVVAAIWNMETRGLQTGQVELQTGFDPADRSPYRITLVGEDKNGQSMVYQFFRGKLRPEGGLNLSEEGFKMAGWNHVVESDNLRPAAFDAFRWIKID